MLVIYCIVGNRCTLIQHNSVPSLNNRLFYVSVVEIAVTWAPDILKTWVQGFPIQVGSEAVVNFPSAGSLSSIGGVQGKVHESFDIFIFKTAYFNSNCVLFQRKFYLTQARTRTRGYNFSVDVQWLTTVSTTVFLKMFTFGFFFMMHYISSVNQFTNAFSLFFCILHCYFHSWFND